DYLNKFVNSGSKGENNSHIVLTTHNPIAIAELTRDQVQILSRDDETRTIESHKPHYDPQGMGYAGIITSDMFGLGSSLDKRTQKRLETYRALASIENKTKFEALRFQVISEWLDNDRFSMSQRDDDYERYIKIRNSLLKEQSGMDDYQQLVNFALSLSQEKRDEIAKQAITKLLQEDQR
ncbi:chromosome segregation protein SMC, partial [Vibrio anguillarum]|nr:chromosome segregation protein SMC [Vibrio anguillarum]